MQLNDTLEGFWLSKRRNLSPNTARDYELTFRRLAAWLKSTELGPNPEFNSIRSEHIDQFLNDMEDEYNLAPKTLLNHWIALSALWTWAAKALKVEHIIRGQVDRPKASKRRTEPYTRAEVTAMLDACDTMQAWDSTLGHHVAAKRQTSERDRALILVLLDCGIRASELTALRMQDYDRKRGQLTILHGKGDKKRTLYLGDAARTALWRYLTTWRKGARPEDPLFVTRVNTAMDRANLFHLIDRIGQRVGIKDAGVHRFRHTFAINYLRNGGNLLGLQQMLGHEELDTVRIYARLAEVDLEQAQRAASPADNWRL